MKVHEERRNEERRVAVLIDADNTSYKYTEALFAEVSKFGRAIVKRIYGDWGKGEMKGWSAILNEYAINPVQQGRYTTGKNATDSRMIIDAMDLLYSERYDSFCLVSSDSDFTALASRLRESGVTVYGFGMKKTPKPFVNACDVFKYFEAIAIESQEPATKLDPKLDTRLQQCLLTGVEELSGDDGYVHLSKLQRYLNKQIPDFDPRNYGFYKFRYLLKSLPKFDLQYRGPAENPRELIFVGLREYKKNNHTVPPLSSSEEQWLSAILDTEDAEIEVELYTAPEDQLPTGEEKEPFKRLRSRRRRRPQREEVTEYVFPEFEEIERAHQHFAEQEAGKSAAEAAPKTRRPAPRNKAPKESANQKEVSENGPAEQAVEKRRPRPRSRTRKVSEGESAP